MTHHFGAESVLSSHSQSIPPNSFNFSISFSFIPRAGGVSGSSSCTVTAQRSLESVHSASESLSGRTQCATCGRCSARSPHRSRRGRCPSVCSSELKVSAAVLRRGSTRGAERGQTRGTVRGGTGGREQSVFVLVERPRARGPGRSLSLPGQCLWCRHSAPSSFWATVGGHARFGHCVGVGVGVVSVRTVNESEAVSAGSFTSLPGTAETAWGGLRSAEREWLAECREGVANVHQ